MKLFCKHKNNRILRWHYVHYPDYEPIIIEAELFCQDCGKKFYVYEKSPERYIIWEKYFADYQKV